MNKTLEPLFESLIARVTEDTNLAHPNLLSLARPSIRLATQRVPYARIEIGQSRIGGIPDVPPGFEWPRWVPGKPRDDKYGHTWNPESPTPLGFIAQMDLSELPRVDNALPDTGWLYFFYDRYCEPWGFDSNDRGCCRIIYANCDRSELRRTEAPADADREHLAEACLIEGWPQLTLPDSLPDIEYGTPAFESYYRLCEDLTKANIPTCHRLLGHPQLIQNPMELECQLASNGIDCGNPSSYQNEEIKKLEAGAKDWRLLLQIDTDEDGPGWIWGDVGRIYFWVKKQDLKYLRFDDAWLIFQCS